MPFYGGSGSGRSRTVIHSGAAAPVGENVWHDVARGVGALGQYMSAQAATEGAKRVEGQNLLAEAGYQQPTMADVQVPLATELSPGAVSGIASPDLTPVAPVVSPHATNPFLTGPVSTSIVAPQIDQGVLGDRGWNPFGNPTNAFAAQEMGNSRWGSPTTDMLYRYRSSPNFQYGGL